MRSLAPRTCVAPRNVWTDARGQGGYSGKASRRDAYKRPRRRRRTRRTSNGHSPPEALPPELDVMLELPELVRLYRLVAGHHHLAHELPVRHCLSSLPPRKGGRRPGRTWRNFPSWSTDTPAVSTARSATRARRSPACWPCSRRPRRFLCSALLMCGVLLRARPTGAYMRAMRASRGARAQRERVATMVVTGKQASACSAPLPTSGGTPSPDRIGPPSPPKSGLSAAPRLALIGWPPKFARSFDAMVPASATRSVLCRPRFEGSRTKRR